MWIGYKLSWIQFRKTCLFNFEKKNGFLKLESQLPSSLLVFGILVIHLFLFLILNHYLNSRLSKMWISYPFSVPTDGNAGQTTQRPYVPRGTKMIGEGQTTQETAIFKERMIYISSGIAFILLLVLCFIIGFWCYRCSILKRIKRLFSFVVLEQLTCSPKGLRVNSPCDEAVWAIDPWSLKAKGLFFF